MQRQRNRESVKTAWYYAKKTKRYCEQKETQVNAYLEKIAGISEEKTCFRKDPRTQIQAYKYCCSKTGKNIGCSDATTCALWIFPPPYSPELNPIEKVWAILKSIV